MEMDEPGMPRVARGMGYVLDKTKHPMDLLWPCLNWKFVLYEIYAL